MEKKKVFIVGGKGFVGSAFARYAEANALDFAIIQKENYREYVGKTCDILVNANGNSRKFLADEDPGLDFELSVNSVIRTLNDFRYGKYIFISSVDVYDNVKDPGHNRETAPIDILKQSRYGFHKYLAEQAVRKYARDWLIVRLGGVLGKGLRKNPVYDLLNDKPLWVAMDSDYQYLNTDDLARIVFELVSKVRGNELFNVCGDGCVSIRYVSGIAPSQAPVRFACPAPRKEHYEVNIEKLRSIVPVPRTDAVVREFVRHHGKPLSGAAGQE